MAGVSVALLTAPGLAAGAPRLHTGSDRYVRLVKLPGIGLTAALTPQGRKRLGRRLRGRVLDGACTTLGTGFLSTSSSMGEIAPGPGGRPKFVFILDRHADYCDFRLSHLSGKGRRARLQQLPGPPFDSLALTQRGAAYLDDDRITAHMEQVLVFADVLAGSGHYPSASRVASLYPHRLLKVSALSSPAGTPASDAIGVFSDGVRHIETVGETKLGRRLFVDWNKGILTTNAAAHLFRFVSDQIATFIFS
jgi:hypothetical protein